MQRTGLAAVVKAPVRRMRKLAVTRHNKLVFESGDAPKVVIGAGHTKYPGWISTDIDTLDLLDPGDWDKQFTRGTIAALLAEHVWEHIDPELGKQALRHCFDYLRPGGYIRIAVPDGFHPDPAYIRYVEPGGTGPGADDHKILYNHEIMDEVLRGIGFDVSKLEYFDRDGTFHAAMWKSGDGVVKRSACNDSRNIGANYAYTSLIVDGIKPTE